MFSGLIIPRLIPLVGPWTHKQQGRVSGPQQAALGLMTADNRVIQLSPRRQHGANVYRSDF